MGFSKEEFYDASKVAILPIGLCYPGRSGSAGDAPPRPECAPLWRERLLGQMPSLKITLLCGGYAQTHSFASGVLTTRVRTFQAYFPNSFPLPHHYWRSMIWILKN